MVNVCKNCGLTIYFDRLSQDWFHKDTENLYCKGTRVRADPGEVSDPLTIAMPRDFSDLYPNSVVKIKDRFFGEHYFIKTEPNRWYLLESAYKPDVDKYVDDEYIQKAEHKVCALGVPDFN